MDGAAMDTATAERLERLACAHRILEMEGHGDLTLGHMSLRDAGGRGFWLKRQGIGLGEVRDARDFILVDFDGRVLAGDGSLHREWPIHAGILRRRPDAAVVAHTHPFHACLFSATREPLRSVIQEGAYFAGGVPLYEGTSGLVDTAAKGDAMAETMGAANAVFMVNHGVSFCGPSVEIATLYGVFLEKLCKAQITLNGSGLKWYEPTDRGNARKGLEEILPAAAIQSHFEYLKRRLPPL
jgi:L-fuculose-phosphate aldolase